MRKLILITTALVLVSATAHASGSGPRSLTMASNEEPAATAPAADLKPADAKPVDAKPLDATPADVKPADAKPAEVSPAEGPKFVDRPAAVGTKPQQSADQCPCAAPVNADAPKTVKPKRRHESTEARVIYELHRHGIYW
jgi:hypothetical protein